ncbi:MAG: sugar phosphate isomerase/epimerase [Clostridiales bacterium]|nr:sugar phosphate isomerase/epimerase [Clostridiales bacterium]HOA84608.1 sugar phosphate isomerase/epimerase [Bacillota bacterium]
MKIGAQLYTVREYCQTTEGFAETLKKIADIGYTTVQVSGTCKYEPEWLAEQLKQTGLSCVITHTNPAEIQKDPEGVVRAHNVFGCRHIGIGSLPGGCDGLDKIDEFIEEFLPVAKAIRDNGSYLMYHNHHFEFGKYNTKMTYLERMIEAFPADSLGFTLDTYWIQVGGGNPAEWIIKLKGRVPCIHLKDLVMFKKEQRMAPVGYGNINFDAVISAAESAGTEYLLVEQDNSYGENPFDALKKSYEYLRSKGLE